MPIQLFCFGFGIKFEYLVLIGFEINFFKSDMPVTLKPLKLQQCTLHFWKPPVFFYMDKRGQEFSCMIRLQKSSLK